MVGEVRQRVLVLLLCLVAAESTSANTCAGGETHFLFQDHGVNISWHSSPAYFMTVDLERGLVFSEDYGEPFEGCTAEERILFESCIKSFAFEFAVPKNYQVSKVWTFNGRKYTKIDIVKLSALGKSEQVDRIVSEHQGTKFVYFYSLETGLRGIVLPREFKDVAQFFLSANEKGPFATCKDS